MKFETTAMFTHYVNRVVELKENNNITTQEAWELFYNACEAFWNERYGEEKKFEKGA
jgi:hypothetical protein